MPNGYRNSLAVINHGPSRRPANGHGARPGGGRGFTFSRRVSPGLTRPWRGGRIKNPERRQCGGLFVPVRPCVIPSVVTTRGLDLSGTLDRAGGIGGLLARSRHATSSPYAVNGNSFYHADGNGNVTYLASSGGGTDAAYRYDPFGRWLAQTGPYASANVMRFSSKPWVAHNGSNTDGLYYYGYRFYDPLTQRWLNKDPFGEAGFETLRRNRPSLLSDSANLYLFVFNNPNSWIDLYGLAADSITAAIEACMRQPTPAARLSCLEELFGDVCFNPRNTDVIKNALREARNEAGKEAFKGKSSYQLSSEVSKAAKDWLRNRCDCKSSREELEGLREIARRAVEQGKDTTKKVQEERLRRIDDALNEMLE